MKLGSTVLTNTDRELLSLILLRPMVSTERLVLAMYPETQQREKKSKTFTRTLRRLERFGKVRNVNGGWIRTD